MKRAVINPVDGSALTLAADAPVASTIRRNRTITRSSSQGRSPLNGTSDDEHRVWLSINTFDNKSWPKEGWHPSFTYLMSHYRPVIKRLPNGQWQISFTDELSKDLP